MRHALLCFLWFDSLDTFPIKGEGCYHSAIKPYSALPSVQFAVMR